MRLGVKYLDGTEADIAVSASARHLFEEAHGPIIAAMGVGKSNWADELAHTTLSRSGQTDLELLEWLDTVETITWAMPEDRLQALAATLGVTVEDPTGEPGEAPSRGTSAKPRSPRAKTSKRSSASGTPTPASSTA